jgi:heme-degrading monooxygenase HmoA
MKREGAVIAIIWRYRVARASERRFEQAYGSDGDWATLFGESEGYIRTELLRGGDGDYLTIDYWRDTDAWEVFSARRAKEYRALDARCDALTEAEERVGLFAVAPGRS